jgi:8-oxo-dGTP diphosphatase
VTTTDADRFATPRVAAGVLFRDAAGRVLLVKPTYKDGWEIPGSYVEAGESPRTAAAREVQDELGQAVELTEMLVLDWAPHPAKGDKLLIIFDGGHLDQHQVDQLAIARHELSDAQFFDVDQLADVMPARLARRVIYAATGHDNAYLEHGAAPTAAISSPVH